MFDAWRGFKYKELCDEWHGKLAEMARIARGNILKMTTLAASGHPGGSMSSIDVYLTLYNFANVDPNDSMRDDRDRIIVSHGHTSPGAYSALAAVGFVRAEDAITGFRQAGSPFEGHVERAVPGIEWGTGNLGQGLAVGVGKAIYSRLSGKNFHTYVVMGDGEQQKGQISESRRIAVKYGLKNLTAIVDFNRLQISGRIDDVMPQNIVEGWQADGWQVLDIDGHDLRQIYSALYKATNNDGAPIMILARTVMGKGVSFMENDESFHGAAVKADKIDEALGQLNIENDIENYHQRRAQGVVGRYPIKRAEYPKVNPGEPANYAADTKMDNRSAFGKALVSVAEANMDRDDFVMGVFDCDLAASVKTGGFAKAYPKNFFQLGISEHSASTITGSLSAERAVSVWADFGVFGVDETYNQARLNDINHGNVKLFCTHCGINVGEDGMTHQCIDYFGLLNSTYGWKVITPADPNQTDRVVRYVLTNPGNYAVIMGRSAVPMVTDDSGKPFFGRGYTYRYGRMDTVRPGEKLALVSAGNMLFAGLEAWKTVKDKGHAIALISVSDWSDLHPDDLKMLAGYEHVVTLEDHNVKTGLGTAIGTAMLEAGLSTRLTKLGVTCYGGSGRPAELYRMLGIDAASVADKLMTLLE
ncbi:MAG: transketolase [Candidatus Zixiibacteriota bacterium]|nr:MAG: transketolase [candidate division Zixibacteria bacterium]